MFTRRKPIWCFYGGEIPGATTRQGETTTFWIDTIQKQWIKGPPLRLELLGYEIPVLGTFDHYPTASECDILIPNGYVEWRSI